MDDKPAKSWSGSLEGKGKRKTTGELTGNRQRWFEVLWDAIRQIQKIERQRRMEKPCFLMHSSCRQTQRTKYKVSSTKYQVSHIKYQVSSTKYKVPIIKYQVSSIKYQVPNTKYQGLSIKFQAWTTTGILIKVLIFKCIYKKFNVILEDLKENAWKQPEPFIVKNSDFVKYEQSQKGKCLIASLRTQVAVNTNY